MDQLRIEEKDSAGDYLECFACDHYMYLMAVNPGDGDTETGLGREGSTRLTKEDAEKLANFLLDWVRQE